MPSTLAFHKNYFCGNCFLENLPNPYKKFPYYSRSHFRLELVSYFDIFDIKKDIITVGFTPHIFDIMLRRNNIVIYKRYCCICGIDIRVFNNEIFYHQIKRDSIEIVETTEEDWKKIVLKDVLKNI